MARLTKAKTAEQALQWLVDYPHHEGYAYGPLKNPDGLVLKGRSDELRIPKGLVPEGWMQPSDFDRTRRMFEPTDAGRIALSKGETKP